MIQRSTMHAAATSPQPRRPGTRVTAGRWLDRCGQLGLPLAAGVTLGYWLADQGLRWMPTMLEALSVLIAVALLLILVGQWLKGKVVREAEQGGGVRKRTVVLLVLGCLAAVVRLGVYWMEQPSLLTSLPPEQLVRSFTLDCAQYRRLDRELELLVQRVEQLPRLRAGSDRQALTAAEERLLRDIWSAFYNNTFALEQIRVFWEDWYRFDPSRAERPLLLRAFLLTFTCEAALFEKGLRVTRLLAADPEVATFLDAPHAELDLPEQSFSRLRGQLLGSRDEARVLGSEQYLRFLAERLGARQTAADLGLEPLWHDLERHLGLLKGAGVLERAEQTARADLQVVKRAVRRTWFPTQKGIADWMGNVKTRRLGRYLITSEQLAAVDRRLEPGDILLSRKNWYLSNLGLPGFWPHAILYIGDPEELDRVADDQQVRSYLRALSGQELTMDQYLRQTFPSAWARYHAGLDGEPVEVIEAVGEGVLLRSLHHAAGDYLAALRPRLSPQAKVQAIIEAFRQLDKPYDFDFDFATDHALVCTELVWRAYRPAPGKEGLELPLVEIAGRLTLPANQIARLYAQQHGRADQQLDFVYFLDGREEQQQAVVADEASFRASHQRFKWDILQR